MALREKIVEILKREDDELYTYEHVADAILAIPELAEALEYRGLDGRARAKADALAAIRATATDR